jgi:homoserine dehydrogenase
MKTQPVFLLGFGGVGRALAKQIVAARALHAQRNHLRLNVIGISDSTSAVSDPAGFGDDAIAKLVNQKENGQRLTQDAGDVGREPQSPITNLQALPGNSIVIDTSASVATVPLLLEAKSRGMGVVLANKLPVAGKLAWWDAIADDRSRWETTCGAALPVISTLNTLLDSGDEVTKIEGSLSGTLGFLSSQLEAGVPFGEAVRDAKMRGYTEPDPRQDLGGLDAARKALILARMLGYRLEMSDVAVESLYPVSMDGLSVAEFLREADTLNDSMATRARELTSGGKKLRYAATVADGKLSVGLVGADPSTKLGGIRTSDSIVVFHTKYFSDNPVAVSGRGAGQEVTASGVLGDVVSLARGL